MLANAFRRWWKALLQGGTWTALVWGAVFGFLPLLLLLFLGTGSLLSALFATRLPLGSSHRPPMVFTDHVLPSMLLVYVIIIVISPFFTAGIYGLLGQAVKGQPVTWGTFWVLGRRLYGRSWGFIGYIVLYVACLALVSLLAIVWLHVLGIILIVAAIVFSMPWALRMTGGLFVDQNTWGHSLILSFRKSGYWPLLGGLILTGIAALVILTVIATRAHDFLGKQPQHDPNVIWRVTRRTCL